MTTERNGLTGETTPPEEEWTMGETRALYPPTDNRPQDLLLLPPGRTA